MAVLKKPDYNAVIEKILANPDMMLPESPSELKQDPENLMRERELLQMSGISERHKSFRPEDSKSEIWTEKFNLLLKQIGTGTIALIIGTRGSGKSQLAACAIGYSCKKLKSSIYIKAFDFFLKVRATYNKDTSEKSEDDIVRCFASPSLLVIDSIENRSDSPFENLLLNHLIDLRYDAQKDTILIGNVKEETFAASMGPSIIDRIHECGVKIVCNWKSFR